jgi:23S rRNA pseudouridine1911/1915/1917 synthase
MEKSARSCMMDSMGMTNSGYIYTDQVPRSDEGRSIAAYYALYYAHSDEETWRRRIKTGQVQLNGRPAAPDDLLVRGDHLTYHRPPWEEPEVPRDFGVLYGDADLLVLSKPSGLPVLPGGGFLENTLLHLARLVYGSGCSPLHRLGRGTSGAILFTRNAQTARFLTAAMESRRIRKVYLALVSGTAMPDAFTVDAPIGPVPYGLASTAVGAPGFARGGNFRHTRPWIHAAGEYGKPKARLLTIHAFSPDGRPSTSHVRVIRRLPQENATILEVTIPTGRPHQIRIHLAYAGFPLVGDSLYQAGGIPRPGGEDDRSAARPGDVGYFLHSWKIRFPHPAGGQDVEVVCPPPPILNPSL